VRICIAYDCLFPWTIGGAERWYRNLAERLAADGHAVTYLTRLQWDAAEPPRIEGVRVIAVSGADELYGADGNRRVGPPLRFGRGVLGHLLRYGRSYDVVHLCSFPYFSLLGAALARPVCGYKLVVDWHEVWSRDYWDAYLGRLGGMIGYAVQRLCVLAPQRAFCFSRLHRDRLIDEGMRTAATVLEGEYDGPLETPQPRAADRLVLFAGRQIAEKNPVAAVTAIARARERGLDVTGLILGDGPEHQAVLDQVAALGMQAFISAPGFVDAAVVEDAMTRALCLLHPSRREGYGLVVVEAAAHGTPTVVIEGPDNAAVELVESGVNGIVAASADRDVLSDALLAIDHAGVELRERTCAWFGANADRLSLASSLNTVAASYALEPSARS
jgi:glycosyltransferase involved in cell wall biosynthesis